MTWLHWRRLFPLLVKWSNFPEITVIIKSRWRTSEGYLRRTILEMGRSIFHYLFSELWFHFLKASKTWPTWDLTCIAFLCFKAHLNSVFIQNLKTFEQSALYCQQESHTLSLLECTISAHKQQFWCLRNAHNNLTSLVLPVMHKNALAFWIGVPHDVHCTLELVYKIQ